MANTTDLMITSFFDEAAIDFINRETGLDFKQITSRQKCGSVKVLAFEAFGTCPRCIGADRINELIAVFKKAPFSSPEYAVLLIDDDNGVFTGVVQIEPDH